MMKLMDSQMEGTGSLLLYLNLCRQVLPQINFNVMKINKVLTFYKIAIGEFPFNENHLKSNFQVALAAT